ncbi:unnamed protein product [Rhizophagus irregularis]|uniref:Uncharacterized protein n=1 Tax=Rhizophagus irregularis TaxID=588596 RepID=A0A916E261_9GLOM|nr:unnamed protein product [Rhizophagus irregularis]CAB5356111.1 unnamed protein product [Rhizophagus irregularis]
MLYFTLTASNTPEELVKAATLLLSTIKEQPKLTNAFHMEVEISNENVLFRYITEIRNKIPPEMDGPSVVNLNCKDLEKRKAYTPCNRTSFHAKNLCEYNHTEHICMVKVQPLDSQEEICNFYCPTKLIFEKFLTEDYIMLLRREII